MARVGYAKNLAGHQMYVRVGDAQLGSTPDVRVGDKKTWLDTMGDAKLGPTLDVPVSDAKLGSDTRCVRAGG